jgi:tellurite methyltransferase
MAEDRSWKEYNTAGAIAPPRPRLVQTLDRYFPDLSGQALDLGFGGGRDTKELLRRGWQVDAVENDECALELGEQLKADFPCLKVIASDFESFAPRDGAYDLINGSYSVPFCRPEAFAAFWERLQKSLKPGGILSCELFGTRDSWNAQPPSGFAMSFFSKPQVEELLQGLQVELLQEQEFDGATFAGAQKHWHLFLCVARRPHSS